MMVVFFLQMLLMFLLLPVGVMVTEVVVDIVRGRAIFSWSQTLFIIKLGTILYGISATSCILHPINNTTSL